MAADGKFEHETEKESLKEAISQALDECRMVLPGIQALFGFQLICVFNERFDTDLSPNHQLLHLAALTMVAVAIACIMAPAAYHRQVEQGEVSLDLLRYTSNFLRAALVPLALGLCLDVYLVARVISREDVYSALLAILLGMLFFCLWFVFPGICRSRKRR